MTNSFKKFFSLFNFSFYFKNWSLVYFSLTISSFWDWNSYFWRVFTSFTNCEVGNLVITGVIKRASRKLPFYLLFSEGLTDRILRSLLVFLLSSDFFGVRLELNPLLFLLISEFTPIMLMLYLSSIVESVSEHCAILKEWSSSLDSNYNGIITIPSTLFSLLEVFMFSVREN